MRACEDGLNVLIWFSINLAVDEETGLQTMSGPATGSEYFGESPAARCHHQSPTYLPPCPSALAPLSCSLRVTHWRDSDSETCHPQQQMKGNRPVWGAGSPYREHYPPSPLPADCVAGIVAEIEAKGLDVVHLVSIGGWNSPHPRAEYTGEEWW